MKPEWKHAPEWAHYLAQDYNGEWYWFELEPVVTPHVDGDTYKVDGYTYRRGEVDGERAGRTRVAGWSALPLEKRP